MRPDPAWAHTLKRYLKRSALEGGWILEGTKPEIWPVLKGVILIPALAEGDELFATLETLTYNEPCALAQLLVLIIVNHRCDAPAELKRQNLADLERLRTYAASPTKPSHLNLGWIDAAGINTCLPVDRGGVGMARKIGADLVLPYLHSASLLIHLDADTHTQGNYASTLLDYARQGDFYAGVVAFAHRPCTESAQQHAMEDYELHMRCHVAGLHWAGSPYAYPSIGSTMVSNAHAYVRVGGMNMRQAGEDFYFMQQLAKTGNIAHINETCVFPAGRFSTRTPFGTGQSIRQACINNAPLQLFYPFACYTALRRWLQLVTTNPDTGATHLLMLLRRECEEGARFLHTAGFEHTWMRLQNNHTCTDKRIHAFHEWFDALKTWRFIRTLGEQWGGAVAAHNAIDEFMPLLDADAEQVPKRYLSGCGAGW
ncbi:MAG: hypothetical protein RBR06_05200 [Desulfuromonadaceae bacterium]|nr:hypothetical protein [Desulfuromonadaceae bacterium]